MSDDLNNKIQQITDILGKENMPDNVKSLLSLLAGSLGSKEGSSSGSSAKQEEAAEETPRQKTAPDDDTEAYRKVKKVLEKANSANDPRINLLLAIKPFMNNRRQKKLSNCIQLLQMTSLARLLNDHEK